MATLQLQAFLQALILRLRPKVILIDDLELIHCAPLNELSHVNTVLGELRAVALERQVQLIAVTSIRPWP